MRSQPTTVVSTRWRTPRLATLRRGGDGDDVAARHDPTPFARRRLSSYRVLEIPTESPNDGPLSVVTNPADPFFSVRLDVDQRLEHQSGWSHQQLIYRPSRH